MKRKILPRRLGEKLILIALALIVFLFFSNDFGLIDIQKSAIILAAGIDKTEQGEYMITANIGVPQSSSEGSNASEVSVTGTGKTVAEAFSQINLKTGWFPKLSFCELIVLGETAVKEDIFSSLNYFKRNENMSDNCLLVACEGSAQKILSTPLPVSPMTSQGLQKMLSNEAKQAGNITTINLKDFSASYYSEHHSGYMPYVKITMATEEEGQGSSEGQAKSDAAQSGKQGSGEQKPSSNSTFDASETALFYKGKQVGKLTAEESFAFSLVSNDIRIANLTIPVEDEYYSLGLKNISGKIKLNVKDNVPTLDISLSATVQTNDTSQPETLLDITRTLAVKEKVLRSAEKTLQDTLLSTFTASQTVGCDLFEIADKLKKYSPTYHEAYKDEILQRVIPSVSVKLNSKKIF